MEEEAYARLGIRERLLRLAAPKEPRVAVARPVVDMAAEAGFLNLGAKDAAGNPISLGTKEKYDEAIRHIQSLEIEEINRYINVCDSIKDALEDPPILISGEKFKNVLLKLYGINILNDPRFQGSRTTIAWEPVLNTIKDSIKNNPEYEEKRRNNENFKEEFKRNLNHTNKMSIDNNEKK